MVPDTVWGAAVPVGFGWLAFDNSANAALVVAMVGTSLVPTTTTSAPWIDTVIGVEMTPP